MRVLQIHNEYKIPGGEDSVVNNEYRLLTENDIETTQWKVSNHAITTPGEAFQTALNVPYSNKSKTRLHHFLRGRSFDIAHVHNVFPLLTTSIYDALAEHGIPIVQTLHNYRSLCAGSLFLRNGQICKICLGGSAYKAVLHKCYRDSTIATLAVARSIEKQKQRQVWTHKVDRFIALTQFARNTFIAGGFPTSKISVKPNFFIPTTPSETSPGRSGALFVGRLSQEKGLRQLLKAWSELNVPLTIAGEGPLEAEVRAHQHPSIKVVGRVSPNDVQRQMQRSQFLVLPSQCYEGFPMVISEAFANGLPVLASRLGSMKELIEDHVTGLHFDPQDAADLQKKVRFAVNNPQLLASWGTNARRLFYERYTPEENFRLLMTIYQQTMAPSSPDCAPTLQGT